MFLSSTIDAIKLAVRAIILGLEPVEIAASSKLIVHVGAIKVVYFSFGRLFILLISCILLFDHLIHIINVHVYFILT